MSGLSNLATRLNYHGGRIQENRMINDKLRSLKAALLYSYQACTAVLLDGREFRCLINPDRLKDDYDNKIISIPFEDICLNDDAQLPQTTTAGLQPTGISEGDIIEWKETGTRWIVYLRHLEEDAYFRAELRRCRYEVEVGKNKYWVYLRGPTETTIQWNQKSGIVWNDLNYSLLMYITSTEETLEFFHRFAKIKITDAANKKNTWEVEAVDSYSIPGIIQVALKEHFNNTIEDESLERNKKELIPSAISGEQFVYPYDIITYTIDESVEDGTWSVSNNKAKIIKCDSSSVTLEIVTNKYGKFNLLYTSGENILELPIEVQSL